MNPSALQLNRDVLLYFGMHHCARLRPVVPEQVTLDLFDQAALQTDLEKVTHDVYMPLIEAIRRITARDTGVRVSFAASAEDLQALAQANQVIIENFRELTRSKAIEWLGLPYHNSLSVLFSDDSYKDEVTRNSDLLHEFFSIHPQVLLASPVFESSLPRLASGLGFKGLLLTSEEPVRHPVMVDKKEDLVVIAADRSISEAVSYRFGAGDAKLTLDQLVAMINRAPGDTVVIGVPLEAFSSHLESGILKFYEDFLSLAASQDRLIHSNEVVTRLRENNLSDVEQLQMPVPNSSRWLSNDLQRQAFMASKELDEPTKDHLHADARHALMRLLNIGHYMSMSSSADLSNPYLSPQDAFSRYMSALQSLKRLIASSSVEADDVAGKFVEAERQHPTTPSWALSEQSRYKENTHSHI